MKKLKLSVGRLSARALRASTFSNAKGKPCVKKARCTVNLRLAAMVRHAIISGNFADASIGATIERLIRAEALHVQTLLPPQS